MKHDSRQDKRARPHGCTVSMLPSLKPRGTTIRIIPVQWGSARTMPLGRKTTKCK